MRILQHFRGHRGAPLRRSRNIHEFRVPVLVNENSVSFLQRELGDADVDLRQMHHIRYCIEHPFTTRFYCYNFPFVIYLWPEQAEQQLKTKLYR